MDVYADQLDTYREQLAAWHRRHPDAADPV
jgi:hypothetical protein